MFKKGQLVRSRKYRDLYVVDQEATHRAGYVWCKPLTKKFWIHNTMLFSIERLELIGNNYKAK